MGQELEVYPAVKVVMVGGESACGIFNCIDLRLGFEPSPIGASVDPASEVETGTAVPASRLHPIRRSTVMAWFRQKSSLVRGRWSGGEEP